MGILLSLLGTCPIMANKNQFTFFRFTRVGISLNGFCVNVGLFFSIDPSEAESHLKVGYSTSKRIPTASGYQYQISVFCF